MVLFLELKRRCYRENYVDAKTEKKTWPWYDIGIGIGAILVVLAFLGVIGLIVFRVGWVNFVDNYEIGYKYDTRSGQLETLGQQGYIITPPILVKVHTVDLRPMQVCINANARVLNCKLVKFNPAGLKLFLKWHGRNNYHQGNDPSFQQILMSYAFDGSGRSYPFLTILRELKSEDDQKLDQEIQQEMKSQ